MRFEVKYSSSQGPHLVDITLEDINGMESSGILQVTKPTNSGEKTITIEGTKEEFSRMAQLLGNFSKG